MSFSLCKYSQSGVILVFSILNSFNLLHPCNDCKEPVILSLVKFNSCKLIKLVNLLAEQYNFSKLLKSLTSKEPVNLLLSDLPKPLIFNSLILLLSVKG